MHGYPGTDRDAAASGTQPNGNQQLRLLIKDYDYVAPLACGDVLVPGVDLHLDRAPSMYQFLDDSSYDVGEVSLSAYLIWWSIGRRDLVGLPFFTTRGFRHRTFWTRRGTSLRGLQDLAGARIGLNAWIDTGNVWARAALQEAGVDTGSVAWTLGPVEDASYDCFGHRPAVPLPPQVRTTATGECLVDLLLDDKLDALLCPSPPAQAVGIVAPLVRLVADYRNEERAYFGRVGYWPAHHILTMRRTVFDARPDLAPAVVAAFSASERTWRHRRWQLADTTPWLLAELEESRAVMGEDWNPSGVADNLAMLAALTAEEQRQGLTAHCVPSSMAFADYLAVTGES